MIKLPTGVLTAAIIVFITKDDKTGLFHGRVSDLDITAVGTTINEVLMHLSDRITVKKIT